MSTNIHLSEISLQPVLMLNYFSAQQEDKMVKKMRNWNLLSIQCNKKVQVWCQILELWVMSDEGDLIEVTELGL